MEPRNRASSTSVEDRYKVLLDVGRILTATLAPEALYRTIFEQTQRVLDLAGFVVATYDDVLDTCTVVFHSESGNILPAGTTFKGSDTIPIRRRVGVLSTDPLQAIPPHVTTTLPFATICSPMVHDEKVLGLISAYCFSEENYDARDLELICAIADHAAVAVANSRFLEERERRRREAERLEEIGRALTASLDLPRVLERVAHAALDLTAADSATVWLVRNDREIEVAMTAGDIAPPRGLIFPIPDSLRYMARAGKPLVFADLSAGHELPEFLRLMTEAASSMAVVLRAENELLGALSIGHRKRRDYTFDEVRLLERLSFQAAIAVANARLHEEILALSLTDPLTGLPNRRSLELFLEKEFAAAQRGRRLTVMLFDLDNFKAYNDRAGHQAGDEVLRAFARVLIEQTRAMNLAARYGGDEFITILADTDRRGGFINATRVARAVANDPLLSRHAIRTSVGIATYSDRMTDPADLIRAADRDLYARKAGRAREIRA